MCACLVVGQITQYLQAKEVYHKMQDYIVANGVQSGPDHKERWMKIKHDMWPHPKKCPTFPLVARVQLFTFNIMNKFIEQTLVQP